MKKQLWDVCSHNCIFHRWWPFLKFNHFFMNITKPLDHTINAYPFVNRAGYILFHIQKGDSKPFVNSRLEFQACSAINNFSNFLRCIFLIVPWCLVFHSCKHTHTETCFIEFGWQVQKYNKILSKQTLLVKFNKTCLAA